MSHLYKFRLYCNTTDTWEHIWSPSAPSNCPINVDHTIDPNSVSVIDTISQNKVIISDLSENTQGYFMSEGKTFEVTQAGSNVFNIAYPYPVAIHRAFIHSTSNNIGDTCSVVLGPNTVVGVLTEAETAGATVLNVSNTVVQNVAVGMYVNVMDGVNTDDVGRVLNVSTQSNTITVENATTHDFQSSTYVALNLYIIKDYKLVNTGVREIGGGVVGGKPVPINTDISLIYYNASSNTKEFVCNLEFTY